MPATSAPIDVITVEPIGTAPVPVPEAVTITFGEIRDTLLPSMFWSDTPLNPLDWLSLAFLVFLIALAFAAYWWRARPLRLASADLDALVGELRERYPSVVLPVKFWDEEIRPTIERMPAMKGPWQEFREACFKIDDTLRNAHQSNAYFHIEMFEPKSFGFVRHVPALMTSTGILGTFVGIAVGLLHMNMGEASAVGMQLQMQELIRALAVSFRTSIWGLSFAMAVTIMTSTLERRLNASLGDFLQWLDGTIMRGTQHDLLVKMNELQDKQVQAIDGLSHGLTTAFEEILNGKDGQGGIVGAIKVMHEDVRKAQTEGVGELLDNFADKFNERMGDQFENLGESMQQMATANTVYQDAMGEVVGQLEGATSKQADAVSQMSQATEGAMTAVSRINDTLDTLSGGLGDVQKALVDQSAQAEQQHATAGEVLEAARVQNEGWQQHQEAIQNAYHGIEARFDALAAAVSSLVSWHDAVRDELAGVVGGLRSTIEEQHSLTNTLAAEREGLSQVMDRVGLVEEATSALSAMAGSAEQAVSSLALASRAFDETQRGLSGSVGALLNEDRAARQQWSLVQEQLHATAEQLTAGADAFRNDADTNFRSALNSLDSHLDAAVGSLGQAIFALQEQIEVLSEIVVDLDSDGPADDGVTG